MKVEVSEIELVDNPHWDEFVIYSSDPDIKTVNWDELITDYKNEVANNMNATYTKQYDATWVTNDALPF